MALDISPYETIYCNVAYEIECRNFIKMKVNGQKLHENTKALIELHPSIVREYIEKYGAMATVQGLNKVYEEASWENRLVGFKQMKESIESSVE